MVRVIQTRRDREKVRAIIVAGIGLVGKGVDMNVKSRRNGDVVFKFTYPARFQHDIDEALGGIEL